MTRSHATSKISTSSIILKLIILKLICVIYVACSIRAGKFLIGRNQQCQVHASSRLFGNERGLISRTAAGNRAYLGLGFLNGGISGSDLKEIVKSRARILNEGLGVSASLGFYHSIPLIDHYTVVFLVTWPWIVSEAGVDLVLIETSLLFICKSCCSYAN